MEMRGLPTGNDAIGIAKQKPYRTLRFTRSFRYYYVALAYCVRKIRGHSPYVAAREQNM